MKLSLRLTTVFIAATMMMPLGALANPADTSATATETPLRAGTKAVQFGFNGLQLSGSPGGKYWKTEQSAYAAFITLSANVQAPDRKITRVSGRIEDEENLDGMLGGFSLGLSGEYQYHLIPGAKVSPFLGLGAGLSVSFGSGSAENPSGNSQYVSSLYVPGRSTVSASSFAFGISGYATFGIEYFITPVISLTGQFTVGLNPGYSRASYTEKNISTEQLQKEEINKGWSVNLNTGISRLTLSMYF